MFISYLYFNSFAHHNLELMVLLRNKCQEMIKKKKEFMLQNTYLWPIYAEKIVPTDGVGLRS